MSTELLTNTVIALAVLGPVAFLGVMAEVRNLHRRIGLILSAFCKLHDAVAAGRPAPACYGDVPAKGGRP